MSRMLGSYAEPVVKIVAILSVLWSIVLFFISPNRFDLQVWTEDTKHVYPSRETNDLRLPLTYDGVRASAVNLLTVVVQNTGNESIGDLGSKWRLSLGLNGASRIHVLSIRRKRPSSVQFSQQPGAPSNRAAFDVGVFQPGARVELAIAAIYERNARIEPLQVQTSLPGLPIQSERPPRLRYATRLLFPLWLAVFLFVGVPDVLRQTKKRALVEAQLRIKRDRERLDEKAKQLDAGDQPPMVGLFVRKFLGIAIASLFIAFIVATFLGWLLSFFL